MLELGGPEMAPQTPQGEAARVFEEPFPSLERGGRCGAEPRVQIERVDHGGDGARGLDLDPRQLLRGAQRLQLFLEPLPGDLTAGNVADSGDVVDDERA